MWGKKVWKQDMKGYRWTRHVYKQNESPTSSIFWLSFWHLSCCNKEVESYTTLKVYLHNCLMVIKEPRIISSLPCANLFIHFIVHFTEVTKTFLQIVLFILYIFMYICIYVWLYLYWLWWVVWELWKKCWHYLSGPQCIKKKKKRFLDYERFTFSLDTCSCNLKISLFWPFDNDGRVCGLKRQIKSWRLKRKHFLHFTIIE